MMKLRGFVGLVVGVLVLVGTVASAQVQQPPLLNAPTQYNPINVAQGAGGNNPAVVTIAGVPGQRVRIYSVTVYCNTPGTNFSPTLVITDAGNVVVSFGGQVITTVGNPLVRHWWAPGLTFSVGGTVVISGNYGGSCIGGTTINVQADQY